MVRPTVLFVYRIASAADGWHARCISLDPASDPVRSYSDDWPVNEYWQAFEQRTGRQLSFTYPLVEVLPPDYPTEAISVYATEEFVRNAPLEHGIPLLRASNTEIIIIQGQCADLELPFFLTTAYPETPAQYEVELEFQIRGIGELPDVIVHIEWAEELARKGDKYDRMLVPRLGAEPIRIPAGCYLPGTISYQEREAGIVYQVVDWIDDRRATVIIYNSDASVEPCEGMSVVRRYRKATHMRRECRVGTIRAIRQRDR